MLSAVRKVLLNPPPRTIGEVLPVIGGRQRRLTGKTVVITGASSGIGEAAARGFAGRGATVVAVARHLDTLEAVCDSITVDGGTAFPRHC